MRAHLHSHLSAFIVQEDTNVNFKVIRNSKKCTIDQNNQIRLVVDVKIACLGFRSASTA